MLLTKHLSISLLIFATAYGQQTQAVQTSTGAIARPINTSKEGLLLPLLVRQAITGDEWITSSQYVASALQEKALASAQLPDPKFSLGLANMPLDSFDFNQEAMTQLKFSVSQMLPRGDTLNLKKQSWMQKSQLTQMKQFERAAQIERDVSLLWLEAYEAQQSITLIDTNRGLFEQLLEVSQASYSSALGRTRQGDIIKAELELIRLDDRLTGLALKMQAKNAALGHWVSDLSAWRVPKNLPQIALKQAQYFYSPDTALKEASLMAGADRNDSAWSDAVIAKQLMSHPSIKLIEEKEQLAQTATSLSKQAYQAQWGVNASYGYRDAADSGMARSDFLSLGITLDMPIFSQKAQDAEVKAKQLQALSIQFEQSLKLKQMLAKYRVIQEKVNKLNQRKVLYQASLIPQLKQQESVLLAAYNSNDGPFSDVIKARIESLNAQVEVLAIKVALQKQKAEFNYLFSRANDFELADSHSAYLPTY
jgi:hypothetical protein